jgi:NTP pyrophosphatase (non-canonical NTP hydrolase)
MNIFELHERMTAHLFPSYSSTDERFLTLALCGEVGELANMVKKRWRDGVDLSEEIRDELADIRIYLELVARCFNIEGDKLNDRVVTKFEKVIKKHKARLERTEP